MHKRLQKNINKKKFFADFACLIIANLGVITAITGGRKYFASFAVNTIYIFLMKIPDLY
ncbi:MAG: hypothetical protein ABI840_03995 [bacterium]